MGKTPEEWAKDWIDTRRASQLWIAEVMPTMTETIRAAMAQAREEGMWWAAGNGSSGFEDHNPYIPKEPK